MTRRIYVAGHRGMVGSAIVRRLGSDPDVDLVVASHDDLDLINQRAVEDFFATNAVDEVYLAAARVGGIHANSTLPASFIYENLMIQSNVIAAAHAADVDRVMFLGSSCIYPREALQPVSETALLTGPLEPTSEPYALAKISGIKLCETFNRQHGRDYRSVMPANLYGPGDNFHPTHSHVLPALIRRFHTAVSEGAGKVAIWGSGTPHREFLHVDDMAEATIHVMNLSKETYQEATQPDLSHVNVGTGTDVSILELAVLLANVTGFSGELMFDLSKPDGPQRKLLDVSLLRDLGWSASIALPDGLVATYEWFVRHLDALRER